MPEQTPMRPCWRQCDQFLQGRRPHRSLCARHSDCCNNVWRRFGEPALRGMMPCMTMKQAVEKVNKRKHEKTVQRQRRQAINYRGMMRLACESVCAASNTGGLFVVPFVVPFVAAAMAAQMPLPTPIAG